MRCDDDSPLFAASSSSSNGERRGSDAVSVVARGSLTHDLAVGRLASRSLSSFVRSADKTSSFCASFDFHAPPPAGCARERKREEGALDSGGLAACSER